MKAQIFASIALLALMLSGCVSATVAPTTGPALTPAQQTEISAAQNLQAEADLANGVFQIAAVADPALAPDAQLAQKAANLVDSLVPQYIADVTAGGVDEPTLLADIKADLAQILSITASHPAVAAKYARAKAAAVSK